MRKEKVKVGAIDRDKVNDSHGKAFLDCGVLFNYLDQNTFQSWSVY